MSKIFDNFGRSIHFVSYRRGELEPYIVEEAGNGVTYICYDDGAKRAVRRITETTANGVTTTVIEVAYGAWADRATLDYHPVNDDIEEA